MSEIEILSPPRKSAGLNNKKMAIHGMRQIARTMGASYVLPTMEFDFTPTTGGNGDVFIPSNEVFDIATLQRFFDGAVDKKPTKMLSNAECLEASRSAVRDEIHANSPVRNQTAAAFAAFQPTPELKEVAAKITGALPEHVCGLQLRVERDWLEHVARKGWRAGETVNGSVIIIDHKAIFAKVAATEELPRDIFICCDEDDLTVSKSQLDADAKSLGLRLIFKSDFPMDITSRLKRSVVDFEVCLNLPFYVGLTLSTYSNILCMVAGYDLGASPNHFVFNAPSDTCQRRYDFGRLLSASDAVRR